LVASFCYHGIHIWLQEKLGRRKQGSSKTACFPREAWKSG
jgi:hypothetical protein